MKKQKETTKIGLGRCPPGKEARQEKHRAAFTLIGPKDHEQSDRTGREITRKAAFTLIELIVVMAVIAVLVLLATPKFMGYAEKAKYTRDIHLAKTLETGLEDFLIHGGKLEDHLDVIPKEDIQASADKNMLLNPKGFVEVVEDGLYYELTHDFIYNHLNVKVTSNEKIDKFILEAMAAKYPIAAYAEAGGTAFVDRTRGLKGSISESEEIAAPEDCPTPESLNFVFDHSTGTITQYTGTEIHIVIPAFLSVNDKCYMVKIIGPGAFMGKNISTVQLPSTIIVIDDNAFMDNNLVDIIIPNGVTVIGDNAFKDNYLGTTLVPNDGTVSRDESIPDSPYVGDHSGVLLPDDSLIDIGSGAFENNNITTVIIPDSVKNVGDNAFVGNTIESITAGGNTSLGNNNASSLIIAPGTKVVQANQFEGTGIVSVVFPEGLERIEDYAFAYNKIVQVNFPSTLIHVGSYAFAYNENSQIRTITSITFKGNEYVGMLNNDGDIAINGSKADKIETMALEESIFRASAGDTIPSYYKLATDSDFWYVEDSNAPNIYKGTKPGYFKYIGTDEYVIIPPVIQGYEVSDYFSMFRSTEVVKGVASNNPKVTSFKWMFFEGRVHEELDLKYLDTSNVTDMRAMFIRSGYRIDVSGFDTSNVTTMANMFEDTKNTVLDLRNFNTSKVTDMSSMFSRTSKLTHLDISSFDTSNVTKMHFMFELSAAPILDLNHFNTTITKDMYGMFRNATATTIKVDNFSTTATNSVSAMFQNTQALSLDLSSFEFNHIVTFLKESIFEGSTVPIVYVKNQEDADSLRAFAPATMTIVVK